LIKNRRIYELNIQDIYDVAEAENIELTDELVEAVATKVEEMDFGSLYEAILMFIEEAKDERN
jgi:hypothetical protein